MLGISTDVAEQNDLDDAAPFQEGSTENFSKDGMKSSFTVCCCDQRRLRWCGSRGLSNWTFVMSQPKEINLNMLNVHITKLFCWTFGTITIIM